jgi:hypothetical protein
MDLISETDGALSRHARRFPPASIMIRLDNPSYPRATTHLASDGSGTEGSNPSRSTIQSVSFGTYRRITGFRTHRHHRYLPAYRDPSLENRVHGGSMA